MSHLVLVQLLADWCRCRTVPRSRCPLGCDAKMQVRRSVCQCLVSKLHGEGFELFFNVLVYPFLLFGTQTLEIREGSRR
jgi:hypothetical protein